MASSSRAFGGFDLPSGRIGRREVRKDRIQPTSLVLQKPPKKVNPQPIEQFFLLESASRFFFADWRETHFPRSKDSGGGKGGQEKAKADFAPGGHVRIGNPQSAPCEKINANPNQNRIGGAQRAMPGGRKRVRAGAKEEHSQKHGNSGKQENPGCLPMLPPLSPKAMPSGTMREHGPNFARIFRQRKYPMCWLQLEERRLFAFDPCR